MTIKVICAGIAVMLGVGLMLIGILFATNPKKRELLICGGAVVLAGGMIYLIG